MDTHGDTPLLLVSKTAFARAMTQEGLPFPRSEVTTGVGAAGAAARIGYPVIVKPDRSSAGLGLFRATEPSAFSVLDAGAAVVVQRFIEGQIGSTAVLFYRGRPLWWMSSYKQEIHPKPFGPSSVRRRLFRYTWFRLPIAIYEVCRPFGCREAPVPQNTFWTRCTAATAVKASARRQSELMLGTQLRRSSE